MVIDFHNDKKSDHWSNTLMKFKKIIGRIVVVLLAGAAVYDTIRYAKPERNKKIRVNVASAVMQAPPQKIIFVYNAYGGIYPGIADFIHKTFFPKSYPCNLCFQAFGTFGKKEAWSNYLHSIPLEKEAFHRDTFDRLYSYRGELPVILISGSGGTTKVLLSAKELNAASSVEELIAMVQEKLRAYPL